jgi:hypothetical protein
MALPKIAGVATRVHKHVKLQSVLLPHPNIQHLKDSDTHMSKGRYIKTNQNKGKNKNKNKD